MPDLLIELVIRNAMPVVATRYSKPRGMAAVVRQHLDLPAVFPNAGRLSRDAKGEGEESSRLLSQEEEEY